LSSTVNLGTGPHAERAGVRDQASEPLRLVYVRPSFGGVFDYSESVLAILREQFPGARIATVTVENGSWPWLASRRVAREILSHPGVVYADMGSGDTATFWALRRVVRHRRLLVTIHDPGTTVLLARSRVLERGPGPCPSIAWYLDRATKAAFGARLIHDLLSKASTRIALNPSIRQLDGLSATYLPQPVYERAMLPYEPPARSKVAFCGYWSPSKGLEELLAAYRALLPRFPDATFAIAGGAPHAGDSYDASLRTRARRLGPRLELPGFVPPAEFGQFLRGLTALVLPYHPDVPGAASAMLMRAQERGVPLIVSDTPRLRTQVEPGNVTLVPPGDSGALEAAIAAHLAAPQEHAARAHREQLRIYAEHSYAAVGARLHAILEQTRPWVR
jgi:glycosyltransferase involved in cell wall biosynthesis